MNLDNVYLSQILAPNAAVILEATADSEGRTASLNVTNEQLSPVTLRNIASELVRLAAWLEAVK